MPRINFEVGERVMLSIMNKNENNGIIQAKDGTYEH